MSNRFLEEDFEPALNAIHYILLALDEDMNYCFNQEFEADKKVLEKYSKFKKTLAKFRSSVFEYFE